MANVKSWFKALGHSVLYVRIKSDPSLEKFEEMLGFTEYKRTDTHTYMFQRTSHNG